MEPETWRWLIGGGLGALTVGVAWLLRMAWAASAVLSRIEARISFHGEQIERCSVLHDAHDARLREVEGAVQRHSGRWGATT